MTASREEAAAPILEIDRISRQFGDVRAVDDVSISVTRGEFLTFLGPSGCGKTTLLRIIAGFESETSGEIRISGRSMKAVKPYKRPIGIVFQNLALFPHLSVRQNVGFGLQARRVAEAEIRKQVVAVLELVELGGLDERRIHELSGGQKQRVALARALVLKPEVLLLDEPLGALDLKLRRQLQYELKNIQQRVGTTFLFVTHDQEEALTMSDRIAVMNGGRVEQLDAPEVLYRKPANAFVARFIGDTNLFDGTVEGSGPGWLDVSLDGFAARIRLPSDDQASTGTRLCISIRPEHVRLGAEAGAGPLQLRAAVQDRSYVGANTRYSMSAAGTPVIALESNADGRRHHYRIAEEVTFSFDLAQAVIVPDPGRASPEIVDTAVPNNRSGASG